MYSKFTYGKRSDNGFKAEVWREICGVVVRMGGGPLDSLTGEKCQFKLENLKKKYGIWTRLRKMSGWGCDPISGALTAPEEVWNIEIA